MGRGASAEPVSVEERVSTKRVVAVGLLVIIPGISGAQPVTHATALPRTAWGDAGSTRGLDEHDHNPSPTTR